MTRREYIIEIVKERSDRGNFFFRPILMQFAANYIGTTYRNFYLNHKVLVRANIACMEKFGMDAVGLISDPAREAEAFGVHFEYPDEGVPRCSDYPVKTIDDVKALKNPDLTTTTRTQDRIAGAALYRKLLGEKVPVIGWIDGPLAEACALVGVSEMLLMLAIEPNFCKMLLEKTVPTAKSFAQAQIEAGCDIIGMGDAICSQISAKMYVEYVKDLHQEIIDNIHAQDAMIKLHICGNITHLLQHLREVKPDIVDIDWMVDMDGAYEQLGPEIIRSCNLDPAGVAERMSAEDVYNRTRELVGKEQGRMFILSAGCEITSLTPSENLMAMREASMEL